jgi:hypothetical protein
MRIHVATALLGADTRLFEQIDMERVEAERTRVLESPFATHMIFRVVK